MEIKSKVVSLLKEMNPPLCVISTVDKAGRSKSAVVAFAVQEDLSIFLSTSTASRKWKNLQENNTVSLVFGFSFGVVNIQCEGTVVLLSSGEEFEKAQKFYSENRPELQKYRSTDTGIIKVTPTWIRVNDGAKSPMSVEEFSF